MTPGMTVFYRLSEENVADINFSRSRVSIMTQDKDGNTVNVIHHIFHGKTVHAGMLLPAEVMYAYSVAEHVPADPDSGGPLEWARKAFSGYADLRVKLPGNDTLWVPEAEEDTNCKPSYSRGQGVTSVPGYGKFTRSTPAPLI